MQGQNGHLVLAQTVWFIQSYERKQTLCIQHFSHSSTFHVHNLLGTRLNSFNFMLLKIFMMNVLWWWWWWCRTCEICGAIAQNVGGDQTNEASNATVETEVVERSATGPMVVATEPRNFWQGRRIMNILLGCMVFAFIISWLFHFNVLP